MQLFGNLCEAIASKVQLNELGESGQVQVIQEVVVDLEPLQTLELTHTAVQLTHSVVTQVQDLQVWSAFGEDVQEVRLNGRDPVSRKTQRLQVVHGCET